MLSSQIRCVVGIDVAKDAHVVCALDASSGAVRQRATRIEASAQGYTQLCGWLKQWGEPDALLIGLEATGVLWEPLYEAVTQADYTILVLNPRQTSSWAASLDLRAKTDSIDAHALARGVLAGFARGSTLPSGALQSLRTLTRARRVLVQSQSAARQRLHDELVLWFPKLIQNLPGRADLGDPAILTLLSHYNSAQTIARVALADLTATLAEFSGTRWGALEAQALHHLAHHSAASTRAVAARSLVVRTLALHLLDLRARLAELGDVSRFSTVDQVVAYAGLEPRTEVLGRYVGQKRISKRGPGALRHALYLATLVAVRFQAEWRQRYQRLLDRGRTKKEALTILSRSLLKVIYHLVRTGASYDPARVSSQGTGS